jgi:hypothetical protein
LIRLAALLAAASLAAPDPAWRRMPPEDRTAAPEAVGHVATFVVDYGNSIERRDGVMRSGNWIRSDRTADGHTTVHHSHIPSATSFSYARGADGGIEAIRVARDAHASPYYRMHRARTERVDRLLGEVCRVWRTTDVGALTGSEWLSCETRDGLQLWLRELSRSTGNLVQRSRAATVARRRVPPQEVRPPIDFFAIGSLSDGPAWTEPGPDYRVVLESDSVSGGGRGRQIIQRRGAFRSRDFQAEDGSRRLGLGHGGFTLFYEEEPGGRPLSLRVNRMADDDVVEIGGEWVPTEDRSPESILGETCRWMRSTVLASHYRRIECMTDDGIVLQTDEQSMAGHTVYRATSLSRRRLLPADFRLPARALSWNGWGVTRD